ncbi:MAG: tRNA (N6-isopentenyl adenosine(37)-C2)-methylthiotransferase MiaB [Clostridia bacterium]|nr:tRNA (N6-isopentenyl adenosine(37)-C2)-methylthiotransferase MiaB [Clostridia bacterium]
MKNINNTLCEDTSNIENQNKYAERVRKIINEKISREKRPLYVFIQTFGCQQNEADSERLLGSALSLGYEKADSIENADLIIFNTCAVREHAELKAFSKTGQLKHLKEKNPDIIIGLWGCMVNQEHRVDEIKHNYPYVNFAAGTNMLHRLPEILCDVLETNRRRYYVDDSNYPLVEGIPVKRMSDIKAWISIMYGCNNFCTYCVVPYVRGRERSRDADVIVEEAKNLIESGYKEITLLGQNVNSYGSDKGEVSFAKLLQRIAELDGEFIVRFMTSHPKDVSDELIDVIATHKKIERHFHLPIQSGSDEILFKMNRKYTTDAYTKVAEKLKKAIPDIVFTTDIIVAFPGETDEDFEKTLVMCDKIGYDSIYSFIFSPRKGTPAEKMENNITDAQKNERMSKLLSQHRERIVKINKSYENTVQKVLCETKKNESGCYFGKTSGFKLVKFTYNGNDNIYGRFVDVLITSSSETMLTGKMI